MDEQRKRRDGIAVLVICLLPSAGLLWLGLTLTALTGSEQFIVSCIGVFLGCIGGKGAGMAIHAYLAKSHPWLLARGTAWFSSRYVVAAGWGFLTVLMLPIAAFFVWGAIDPQFGGAVGEDPPWVTVALAVIVSGLAAFGGYTLWRLIRVLRGG
ncbi:hypothetical protein [Actinopolymorpha rutila]|uniref:Uncharacterized protein n=1 Tax=Actinopolymorpha rutila TaxID=446787 RepID=A0A852ZW57_9ACTN|nr:hypothetical protein [Actinopolymorpha rutila]NYH92936.1 hypothetical protein [Actinopolymorpha rutila]